ncbi:MAG: sigma-70 family RNA polymerase sigma factor [Eubacteriales bacterium]|nr:sigma-70 family RNA polymerase sigma factor [Eubacteriales bacterium]
MNHQQKNDELRARFTVWLETVVYRAKLKYLNRYRTKFETVSIEELPEDMLSVSENIVYGTASRSAFDFEEERLAEAFANLPIKRQQILTMLFVEERKPEEIARLLNCSAQHVYDQRYQALKKLRQALAKGGDEF